MQRMTGRWSLDIWHRHGFTASACGRNFYIFEKCYISWKKIYLATPLAFSDRLCPGLEWIVVVFFVINFSISFVLENEARTHAGNISVSNTSFDWSCMYLYFINSAFLSSLLHVSNFVFMFYSFDLKQRFTGLKRQSRHRMGCFKMSTC